MAIRKLINAIISDVTDCINLLSRFDKLQNNIHGYNTALSALRSEFKQLGADISVVVMNLLVALEPVLTPLLNVVEWLTEQFANLFAVLQGKNTYTRANPDYWKDYADSLEESNNEAKNYIKQLQDLMN